MMIGLPGSGKSQFIDWHYGRYPLIRVCPDDIRKEVFGIEFDKRFEEHVWNMSWFMMERIVDSGYSAIFDSTMCRIAWRKTLFDKFKDKANIIGIWLQTPMTHCYERRPQLKEVLDRMWTQFEEPKLKEGFSEIQIIKEFGRGYYVKECM